MAKFANEIHPALVHERNLVGKENHRTKYRDPKSQQYLREIRARYDEWHAANVDLIGPGVTPTPEDCNIVARRVQLLREYKDFLDAEKYAVQFDSRSNLHSSVLEQFIYYLFRDLVADFGAKALIGKSHTFKDLFFVPPGYRAMLDRPHAKIEKKDHDFVIGVSAELSLRTVSETSTPGTSPGATETSGDLFAEVEVEVEEVIAEDTDPVEDDEQSLDEDAPDEPRADPVILRGEEEVHKIDVPAVVIECKTYLDKTMLEGSSRAAEDLKARVPDSLYIVVMERVKLSNAINPAKFKVDQIYVLRRQKNVDREYRLRDGYTENPISTEVVWHLFQTVRDHLTGDWRGGIQHGIERGWLLDTGIRVGVPQQGEGGSTGRAQ